MGNKQIAQQERLLQSLAQCRSPKQVVSLLNEYSDLVGPNFLARFEDSTLNIATARLIGNESLMEYLRERVNIQYVYNLVTLLFGMSKEEARSFIQSQLTYFLRDAAYRAFDKLKKTYAEDEQRMNMIRERIQLVIQEGLVFLLYGSNPALTQPIIWAGKSWFTYPTTIQTLRLWRTHPDNTDRVNWLLDQIAITVNGFSGGEIQSPQVKELYATYDGTMDPEAQVQLLFLAQQNATEETAWVQANIEWLLAGHLLQTATAKKEATLEQAISSYNQLQQFFSREQFPYRWAGIQNGLGRCYGQYQKDDPMANIKKAISYFETAAEVFEKIPAPYDWAIAQNNIGSCYMELAGDDKPINREKAKQYLNAALTVQRENWTPNDWAFTQTNLGLAFSVLDTTGSINTAIEHFNNALRVWTKKDYPDNWAELQMKMAMALHRDGSLQRAASIEEALQHMEQALTILTPIRHPIIWAQAMTTKSDLYQDRIKGERIANIESSIACLQQVVKLYEENALPYNTAHTQLALARAYWKRLRGDAAANQEAALSYLEKALSYFDSFKLPTDWASTRHLQGIIFEARIKGDRLQNLQQAEACFLDALSIRTPENAPASWAETLNSLGNTYQKQYRAGVTTASGNAIASFNTLLTAVTAEQNPHLWAVIQYNAAISFEDASQPDISKAITCYQKALTIHAPAADPEQCFKTAIHLGKLLYNTRQPAQAVTALRQCHDAIEYLRTQSLRENTRRQMAAEAAEAYQLLVHCLLELKEIEQAYYYTSAAKARVAADQAADKTTLIEQLRKDNSFEEQWQQVTFLRTEISAQKNPALRAQQTATLTRLLDDLFFRFPALGADTAMELPHTNEVLAILKEHNNSALLDYYRHAGGWTVFLLNNGKTTAVELSELTDAVIMEINRYLATYEQQVLAGSNPEDINEDHFSNLVRIWNIALQPLQSLLPPAGTLILSPAQGLHLLPLHIAFNSEKGRYLCDDYQICYSQGAAVLKALHRNRAVSQTNDIQQEQLLSVAYSAKDTAQPLYQAIPEAEMMAAYYANAPGSVKLFEENATAANVINACAAKSFHTIHFCCHGNFQIDEPEQSGLLLAGSTLTTEHIRTELRLQTPSLVFLSACQTGLFRPQEGDEAIGLIQSFMAAGAGAVISSMWSVEDNATKELFASFLPALKEMPVHQALNYAMHHIRQQDRWQFPVYWAAFKYTGLPPLNPEVNTV